MVKKNKYGPVPVWQASVLSGSRRILPTIIHDGIKNRSLDDRSFFTTDTSYL